ncbi:glycosyl hydrolase 5 family protein-like [Salvia miltiorrhiza]|uniref:glycosyl hydrolase 5 family protein-like n=1 Tax=Salvia miltiorrhiza TaxID=226208 RepID=UPI0025AD9996|nr:glycosyl hydrolase 5 family protein-like [Salvia miltiorrhiza]
MVTNYLVVFLLLQIVAFCSSSPLSTNSRWIVDDASGKRVKLACVNWASHLEPMIAEGLEKKPINEIIKKISETGFNCVRFTWATYMFTRPDYGNLKVSESLDKYNLSAAKAGIAKNNPQFLEMTVVELHKAVVSELGKNKVMVVLDNHVSRPTWCCAGNDGNGFFGDAYFDPSEWLQGLAAVATTYKGFPEVVGMSMRNELRGGRQNVPDWYKYMQDGANTIHAQSPDFLVIVSGLYTDTNLGYLRSKPFAVNFTNKLVFEAHWYTFGIPAKSWTAQTNNLCATVTKRARDNYFFLTTAANNSFPVFISEFGIDESGERVAESRYITCFLAAVAENDVDWALWTLQGSYILRQGKVNLEEAFGVLDINWDHPRNTTFLSRLQIVQQMNQDFTSKKPTYYKMFHPLSGQCVQIVKNETVLANCKDASRWDQHQDGGLIKLAEGAGCLGVAGDGAAPRVSSDCSSNGSKWKIVSSSGLHLAAQDGKGEYLCLEVNASDSKLVTKKCLCVADNLTNLRTCADNPQPQWFKLVPANV